MDSSIITQLFPQDNFSLIAVILGLPLLGAFVNGVWGQRLGKEAVRLMALVAIGVSFAASIAAFVNLAHLVDATSQTGGAHEHVKLTWLAWEWMHTSGGRDGMISVPIDVKFSIDALSGVMMLVITGVGFLIHLYSTTYMAEDKAYWRFFAYLNLFIFSMLVLVLADNLPLLFVGWEGVGLCSYLLIGFWYGKMPNAAAGKKAFIVNRIGDFGLLVAMFLLVYYCGALDWTGLANASDGLVHGVAVKGMDDPSAIHLWPIGGGQFQGALDVLQPAHPWTITAATGIGLMLLLGCTGKSAQIPLYIWLPDAMAGPTPVSALIHAATMVTAGVYLICRMSFIFVLSPFTMMCIAIIGAATALLAASIALVQNDIKKVLAYSTVSQLGFMFLGVGVGAFSAGFFHVFTHAFFKACLFLGAGSVIHSMHARVHDDVASQDIRKMGGLKKYMPLTFWTFTAATFAIAGCPGTSGFFSKDEILYRAFVNETTMPYSASALADRHFEPFHVPTWMGPALYTVGLIAATMTAFYMFRLLFVTFWGEFRGWTIGRPSLVGHEIPAKKELALGADTSHAHADEDENDEDEHAHAHEEDLNEPGYAPHESPWQMTVPLIILGTFALFAGALNAGAIFHFTPIDHWLEPVFNGAAEKAVTIREGGEKLEGILAMGGIAAFAVGLGLAWWMYVAEKGAPAKRAAEAMPGLYKLLLDKWRVDEIYEVSVVAGVDALADTAASFDQTFVDGILAKLTSLIVAALGTVLRAFQTGVVHMYAAAMVVGLAGFGWFFVAPHAHVTVAESQNGDFTVEAGPGMGYAYRWDQDGKNGFDSEKYDGPPQIKVHLNAGETRMLKLEVSNAFGLKKETTIPLKRAEAVQTLEIGQK